MPWTVGRSRATRPMYRALCMGKMPTSELFALYSQYRSSASEEPYAGIHASFRMDARPLIDKARIYFSGSNLLTWAKWKQYDPETPVNGEVFCEAPAMRTFNFGVQLTF